MTSDYSIAAELGRLAHGLDFSKETDCAAFRQRVSVAFQYAKVTALRGYVRDLHWEWRDRSLRRPSGPTRVGQSRADALRELTGNFILARQLGEL